MQDIPEYFPFDEVSKQLLKTVMELLNLSDLEATLKLIRAHIAEAIQ